MAWADPRTTSTTLHDCGWLLSGGDGFSLIASRAPFIETDRIVIRPLSRLREERAELKSFLGLPEIESMLDQAKYFENKTLDQRLRIFSVGAKDYSRIDENAPVRRIDLVVLDKQTGSIVGLITAMNYLSNRMIELGYITHPDHRGKGFAREAALALYREIRQHVKDKTIYLGVEKSNIASLRVAEKLGLAVHDPGEGKVYFYDQPADYLKSE